MEKSPEVFFVRERMLETDVDLFLDIHGDEGLPFVFVAGTEGVPNYNRAFTRWKHSSKPPF